MPLVVHIARHAESVGNAQRRLQGSTDSPLTVHGVQQAARLGARLRGERLVAIYSSGLVRARATAAAVAAAQLAERGAVVTIDARLREQHFGARENRGYGEPAPDEGDPGETRDDVARRARSVWRTVVARHLACRHRVGGAADVAVAVADGHAVDAQPAHDDDGAIVLVSHGMLIAALLAALDELFVHDPASPPPAAPAGHANTALTTVRLACAHDDPATTAARLPVVYSVDRVADAAHLARLVRQRGIGSQRHDVRQRTLGDFFGTR